MNNKSKQLDDLLSANRERLRRMVWLRLDARLKGRVDASDIVQEALVEASNRYPEYCSNPEYSPFIWLRFLTLQKLAQVHRRHIEVKARSVRKEANFSPASSIILAEHFIGDATTPLEAALRGEREKRVTEAIESLSESDQEILALRHFEQMSNLETSQVLGIEVDTAYKRYIRALERLRILLSNLKLSASSLS